MDVESLYEAGMRAVNRRGKQLLLITETRLEFVEAFLPGISGIKMSQHRFAMSRETNAPMEVDMVLVRNEEDVQTVIDIFQTRVKTRAEDTSNPEYAAVWENNARVTSRGKLVILAVLPDEYGPIPEEFLLN